MYFTQEDYYNIKLYLLNNAIKDTEFEEISLLLDDDYFPIILNNTNKIVNIALFTKSIQDYVNDSFITKESISTMLNTYNNVLKESLKLEIQGQTTDSKGKSYYPLLITGDTTNRLGYTLVVIGYDNNADYIDTYTEDFTLKNGSYTWVSTNFSPDFSFSNSMIFAIENNGSLGMIRGSLIGKACPLLSTSSSLDKLSNDFNAHEKNVNNPHSVTKELLGYTNPTLQLYSEVVYSDTLEELGFTSPKDILELPDIEDVSALSTRYDITLQSTDAFLTEVTTEASLSPATETISGLYGNLDKIRNDYLWKYLQPLALDMQSKNVIGAEYIPDSFNNVINGYYAGGSFYLYRSLLSSTVDGIPIYKYNQEAAIGTTKLYVDNDTDMIYRHDGKKYIPIDLYREITYKELKALRDGGNLLEGRQYRITDYQCTTTQENTSSANHLFDIIVTATSKSTLSEQAKAIKHNGDTYFTSHRETFGNTYASTDIEVANNLNSSSRGGDTYLTNITSYDTIDDAITFMNNNRDSDDLLSDSDVTYIKENAIKYNDKYYVAIMYDDIFDTDVQLFDIEMISQYDKYVGIYGGTMTYDSKTYNSRWIRNSSYSYVFEESLETLLSTSPHELKIGSDCNLEAWQLWYTIDNDTNRFSWADATNGKGVIYRMIDERNNDCPYDFKNIMFTLLASEDDPIIVDFDENNAPSYNKIVKPMTFYTFSWEANDPEEVEDMKIIDYSLNNAYVSNNIIESNTADLFEYGINGLAANIFMCIYAIGNKILMNSSGNFIINSACYSTLAYVEQCIFCNLILNNIEALYDSYILDSQGIIHNGYRIRLYDCSGIILYYSEDIKLRTCEDSILYNYCSNITKTTSEYARNIVFEGNNKNIDIECPYVRNVTVKSGASDFTLSANQENDAPLMIALKTNGDIIYYNEADLIETDTSGLSISGNDTITSTGQVTYTIERSSTSKLLNWPKWSISLSSNNNGLGFSYSSNVQDDSFPINIDALPTADTTITITATVGSTTLTKEVTVKAATTTT